MPYFLDWRPDIHARRAIVYFVQAAPMSGVTVRPGGRACFNRKRSDRLGEIITRQHHD